MYWLLNDNEIRDFFFDFVYLERATGETIADASIKSSDITTSI